MQKDSWLYSDSFLKRAFAVWGYNFVASLIIMIPFYILTIIAFVSIGLLFGTFEAKDAKRNDINNQDPTFDELMLEDFDFETGMEEFERMRL